jgi:hypothetical protein
MSKLKIRHSIGRLAQFGLVIDGTLHLAEVASAYYEEAWTTLMLTSLQIKCIQDLHSTHCG